MIGKKNRKGFLVLVISLVITISIPFMGNVHASGLKSITSIEDINTTVDTNNSYTLPKKVTSTMSDGSTKAVSAKWNPSKASARKAGTYNFKGTVAGYDKKVNLILMVINTNTTVYKSILALYKPTSNNDADSIVADAVKSDFSDNTTIDVSGDKYVVYQLNEYNSDNVSLGFDSDPDVNIATSKAGVATVEVVDGKIVVTAGKPGTATIIVTNSKTNLRYTKKITVVDEENTINSVNWKSVATPTHAMKYDYTRVLATTSSGNDPKVSGINLRKSVSYAIRIQLVDMLSGILYVDKDGSGTYDADIDATLGTLSVVVIGNNTPADDDYTDGITVKSGEDCTIIFEIKNTNGKIVAAKSISDNF